jgi:hypothetical protein
MSFYVTLPSNSSMEIFKNNTISNFTTQLHTPIRVNVPYEVGLVEFSYDHVIEIKLGTITYHINDLNTDIKIDFMFTKEEHGLKRAIDNYNEKLLNAYTELIENNSIGNEPLFDSPPKLTLDHAQNHNLNINHNNAIKYQLSSIGPNDFFYFQDFNNKHVNFLYDAKSKDENIRAISKDHTIISTFFIYTDIIKYQYIGDTWAPILRTVNVPNNSENKTQNVLYDSPHYVHLNSTNIDTINIRITDEQGENIRFKRGKSIVKLHFRPIKYGF